MNHLTDHTMTRWAKNAANSLGVPWWRVKSGMVGREEVLNLGFTRNKSGDAAVLLALMPSRPDPVLLFDALTKNKSHTP